MYINNNVVLIFFPAVKHRYEHFQNNALDIKRFQ